MSNKNLASLLFSTYGDFCIPPPNLLCAGRKSMICVAFFKLILPKLHFYSILNLILRFTKEEAEVRKQASPFVPPHYIPTFAVMSEGNCVFLRRKRKFKKIALYPNFDVIS